MRFPFPSGAKLKPKAAHNLLSGAHSDALRTALFALKESADGFPPLKSAVSGVIALWDIAEVPLAVACTYFNELTRR
jgi:hypothetical protein